MGERPQGKYFSSQRKRESFLDRVTIQMTK
jgi:hypothetical protein